MNEAKIIWRRTLPDTKHDFVALDVANCGEVTIGRIHPGIGRTADQWVWFHNHPAGDSRVRAITGTATGFVSTREAAVQSVREAHARFLSAIDKLGLRDRLAEEDRERARLKAIRGW